jgi:hypothetical protein
VVLAQVHSSQSESLLVLLGQVANGQCSEFVVKGVCRVFLVFQSVVDCCGFFGQQFFIIFCQLDIAFAEFI